MNVNVSGLATAGYTNDIVVTDRKMTIDIEYGGLLKNSLLKELNASGVLLNKYAGTIFSSKAFKVNKKDNKFL